MLNVLLSWSGPLSEEIALLFHEILPDLLGDSLKPWMSTEDIPKGEEWFSSILTSIDKSPVCIIFVTKQNVRSSWIYFEAGGVKFATKKPKLCAYLLDVESKDVSSTPIGQMQHTRFEQRDTWRMIRDINRRLESPTDEKILKGNFESKWPAIKEKIDEFIAEYPPEPQEEAEDTRELSDEAKRILMESSEDPNGSFFATVERGGGYNVQTNDKNVCNTDNAREAVTWEAAVDELERAGLVEAQGDNGLFRLTKLGYEISDVLKAGERIQNAPQEPEYNDIDLKNMLHAWFAGKGFKGGTETIVFATADKEAKVPPGTTKRFLDQIVGDHNYRIEQMGEQTARIKHVTPPMQGPSIINPSDNPKRPFGWQS